MSTTRLESTLISAIAALRELQDAMRNGAVDAPVGDTVRKDFQFVVKQVQQAILRAQKVQATANVPEDEMAEVLAMCKLLERELLEISAGNPLPDDASARKG